jgi:hypothetical protein
MTLAELEVHFKSFEAVVGQDISLVRAFFTHVQSEEAKIAAEIAHLVASGYAVVKNEVVAAV